MSIPSLQDILSEADDDNSLLSALSSPSSASAQLPTAQQLLFASPTDSTAKGGPAASDDPFSGLLSSHQPLNSNGGGSSDNGYSFGDPAPSADPFSHLLSAMAPSQPQPQPGLTQPAARPAPASAPSLPSQPLQPAVPLSVQPANHFGGLDPFGLTGPPPVAAAPADPFSDLLSLNSASKRPPAATAPAPTFVAAPVSSSSLAFANPLSAPSLPSAASALPPSLASLPSVSAGRPPAPVLSLHLHPLTDGEGSSASSALSSGLSSPLSSASSPLHHSASTPLSPYSTSAHTAQDRQALQAILSEQQTGDESSSGQSAFGAVQPSSLPAPTGTGRPSGGAAAGRRAVTALTAAEIASIANPLKRAEAVEQQKSLVGNYRLVEPLRAKREQMRAQPVHNILRLQPLAAMRAELERARGQLGEWTCAAIGQRYMAVGTARGCILVFNHFEQLQCVLGKPAEDGRARGPVTCVDMNPTGDQVVAGHARGVCAVWDIATRKEVKDIKDASTRPITHVKFTKRGRPAFIAVDDAGIVTLFTLNKVSILVNVARTVLLQGKAGRVLSVAVLMANPDFPHLSDQFGLVAIATETMTSVIALEPKLAMAYRLPREEDARVGVLPCLCWRSLQARDEVVGKTSGDTSEREKLLVRHPVLVTARGSTISYVQVMPFERHEIAEQRPDVPLKFNHVGMIQVEGEVGGIEWLGGQVLAAVTKDERIHVIDPFELNAQLDSVAVPYLQLVYHKYFPNPETGQAEYGADCSIRASDSSLLLLGNQSLVVVKVMTWSDRVDALVASGHWVEALALALDFYEGQAKAAIGLPRDPRQLQNRLRDQVVEYVVQYVTAALMPSAYPSGRVDRVQLRVIGGCAMEYSMSIGRMDLIFTDVYAKFAALGATDVLCELLEPYILNDLIDAMEPPVTSQFLNYYLADSSRLPQLEQAILHLDPMKLDLNVMLPTVRQVRLFTALEHIYNRALNDFATPLSDVASAIILGLGFHTPANAEPEQLMPSLGGGQRSAPAADTDAFGLQRSPDESDMDAAVEEQQIVIGARLPALVAADKQELAFSLFLYIDYAFTGRWFPRGNDLPDLWYNGVKARILSVLFAASGKLSAKKNTAPVPLPSYPWLSFFLNVSCKHTLSAVANAFDSQDWTVYIDQWSEEEDRGDTQQGGHAQAALAVPDDMLPAIPIPEGESLPEEFLQQQQQQQQLGSDAFGEANGVGRAGADDTSGDAGVVRLTASGVPSRQLMLDALTVLIIDQKQTVPASIAQSSNAYNPHPCVYAAKQSDGDELLQFAAKYVGKGVVQASPSLLNRMFASLTDVADLPLDTAEGKKERAQREGLLVNLLGRCGAGYDYEALLVRCQQARFFNVCVFLYKKRKDFPRILQYYIAGMDAAQQSHTASATEDSSLFDFILSAIADATAANHTASLQQLRSAVLDRLPDLVRADPVLTAKVVVQHFSRENDKVLAALDGVPELQYQYLRAIMAGAAETLEEQQQQKAGGGLVKSASSLSASAPASPSSSGSLFLSGSGFGSALSETVQSSMSDLLQRAGLTFTPRMHEQYVRLLCQFDPSAVLPHLELSMDYSIEAVLRLCQEKGIDDASAYLLERTGDVSGALELMLRALDKRVAELRVFVSAHWQEYEAADNATGPAASNASPHPSAAALSSGSSLGVSASGRRQSVSAGGLSGLEASSGYLSCHKRVLDAIVQASHLCQRSGGGDGEKLWFTLLDRFVQLQRQLKVSQQSDAPTKLSAVFPGGMEARAVAYMHQALIGYVRTVLHSMMGHVRLPVILRKITTDHQGRRTLNWQPSAQRNATPPDPRRLAVCCPVDRSPLLLVVLCCVVLCCCACAADELREFRDTIVSMLDTYSYERSILQTATSLLAADKYMQIERLAAKHASAFTARADYCEACHLPLSDGSLTLGVTLFDCQHAFHDSCLRRAAHTHCPLCQQQAVGGKKRKGEARDRKLTADGPHSSEHSETKEDNGDEAQQAEGHVSSREEGTSHKVDTEHSTRQHHLLNAGAVCCFCALSHYDSTAY